jgi:hypothetical protein
LTDSYHPPSPAATCRIWPVGAGRLGRGGPDVLEVIEVFQAESNDLQRTSENLGLSPGLVEAAVRFYASHKAEIDDAIELSQKLMEEAALAYQREQQLLSP